MWPGQQPPGGEQNPQDQSQNPYTQSGYQQPNPYQQPGYQQTGGYPQTNPYQPQAGQPGAGQPQWNTPAPMGAPQPPPSGDGNRTKIIAIVAATAVVVAAGVTGFLVLGGNDDDKADGGKDAKASASASKEPSASASEDNPRGGEGEKATIEGWKVVINPKWGTAFDVPAEWDVKSPGTYTAFEDKEKGDGSPLITMSSPAYLKESWCSTDSDKDGTKEESALAVAGTKGQSGAKSLEQAARSDSATWAWAGYTGQTDADQKKIEIGKAEDFTSSSGLKGKISTSYTKGAAGSGKCDTEGKATTFAFKNSNDDFVSFSFYGAKGVSDEVTDETIKKIAGTVRLHGDPEDS
ncbi:hypothetical protein ACFV6E_00325 [Streptomyces sp. NPDC059785]|uniref:hypothetical protein n=1 Tax=unclassified Streptomyces TaxID=2593676 RepID=UPI00364FB78E